MASEKSTASTSKNLTTADGIQQKKTWYDAAYPTVSVSDLSYELNSHIVPGYS